MKRLVHFSRGRVRYTGRIDRAAFLRWSESPDGRSVLERLASSMRFALFGKVRAARRRVWHELTAAARSQTVVAALQSEIDSYLARLGTLAIARDLPRVGISLHRLVVVPRLFANVAIDRRIDASFETELTLVTLDRATLVRDWFILTLINSVEAAVMEARPSPRRPLPAGDGWIVVGVNDQFEWRIPLNGPAWPGHYYVLELTRQPMTRAVWKAAAEAIAGLELSLPSLSRVHRNEILRQAGLSLKERWAQA